METITGAKVLWSSRPLQPVTLDQLGLEISLDMVFRIKPGAYDRKQPTHEPYDPYKNTSDWCESMHVRNLTVRGPMEGPVFRSPEVRGAYVYAVYLPWLTDRAILSLHVVWPVTCPRTQAQPDDQLTLRSGGYLWSAMPTLHESNEEPFDDYTDAYSETYTDSTPVCWFVMRPTKENFVHECTVGHITDPEREIRAWAQVWQMQEQAEGRYRGLRIESFDQVEGHGALCAWLGMPWEQYCAWRNRETTLAELVVQWKQQVADNLRATTNIEGMQR